MLDCLWSPRGTSRTQNCLSKIIEISIFSQKIDFLRDCLVQVNTLANPQTLIKSSMLNTMINVCKYLKNWQRFSPQKGHKL